MPDYKLGKLRTKRADGSVDDRYVVTWWDDGKRKRFRLDALTLADAKREAIERARKETKPAAALTVADLWEMYRREKDGRRVAVAMGHEWKALGPHFGHLLPSQVGMDACREYVAQRRSAGKHDGTIWTELGHLRTVFRWAGPEGHRLIPHAPKVERPAKPAPKERYLTHAEIDRLLAAPMAHHIRLAILLMLGTGARVGAVLELTWDRVDLERRQVHYRADALGPRKGRATAPINDMLMAALTSARASSLSNYVVEWSGGPVASIKTGFNAAVKAAGLEKVSPHVLRHTAAVHMVEAGISMEEVAQMLGHSNTAVTFRVYGRFSPTHLRRAAEVLDFTKIRSA
jgi:integrase